MTLQDVWSLCPNVIAEMKNELFRKGDEHFDRSMTSQPSACFMLALRSLSLLNGMDKLLGIDSFDSFDVLTRAFMETRDLLATFRVDDDETRKHTQRWFKDKDKNAWKAQHAAVERVFKTIGAEDLQLAKKWGIFSGLSHPRYHAVHNSVALIAVHLSQPQSRNELIGVLEEKIADYITGIVSLYVTVATEVPGWIDLGCDLNRMAAARNLGQVAKSVVSPIMSQAESSQ